jgi:disulfide oxidoreductase YuzD
MAVRRARRRNKASAKKRNIPTNKKLYARVKAATKRKFAVYPSAYANAYLVRRYKKAGGKYRRG